jgi:nicotinamidase/pyrazinamidase
MNTVFLDVDTQLDFLYPAGALYVPQAERIVPAIARLNRFAAARGIPVICTTDAHSENDREFASWPPHCIAGTVGQHKAEATLIEPRVVIPNRECDIAVDRARQFLVEKQTMDAFQAPNLGRLLDLLGAERVVVYGVVTEICVLYAVRGLLKSGRNVVVVTDAVETLKAEDSERALEEMRAGGATTALVSDICGTGTTE